MKRNYKTNKETEFSSKLNLHSSNSELETTHQNCCFSFCRQFFSNFLKCFVKKSKISPKSKNNSNYSTSRFCLNNLFNRMGSKLSKSKSSSMSKFALSEHEIELLMANTTMSREQIVDFHQNFIQDCPTGYLSKKDFIKMFNELHPNESKKAKADKFCDYVFRYDMSC